MPTSSSASSWRGRLAAGGCGASSEPMKAYTSARFTTLLGRSDCQARRVSPTAPCCWRCWRARRNRSRRGRPSADDAEPTSDAWQQLGVRVERSPKRALVTGCSGSFPGRSGNLFLGNAGTALRPLTAALALNGGHYTLSGVTRTTQRPIGHLVDALRRPVLTSATWPKRDSRLLEIFPATIRNAGHVRVRGDVSSQFLTAPLMALPATGHSVTVEVEGELISRPGTGHDVEGGTRRLGFVHYPWRHRLSESGRGACGGDASSVHPTFSPRAPSAGAGARRGCRV